MILRLAICGSTSARLTRMLLVVPVNDTGFGHSVEALKKQSSSELSGTMSESTVSSLDLRALQHVVSI
jgi:hypothetical protein